MFDGTLGLVADLVESLGLAALVALGYSAMLRCRYCTRSRPILIGLLFGAASVTSMLNPIILGPGLLFDARAVMVALAAPFGGLPAAAVSGSMTAAYRLAQGGNGVYAGILGVAIATAAGIVFARLFRDSRKPFHFAILGLMASTMIFSVFLLPLELAGEVFGKIAVPLTLINTIGVLVLGLFLQSEQQRYIFTREMQEAAEIDSLTKLFNRRKLETIAPKLAPSDRAAARRVGVVLFDIDHFKRVNDRFGHAAGDKVLAEIAGIIRRNASPADDIIRLGGEEFAVIMPQVSKSCVLALAERVRNEVEALVVCQNSAQISVTISAGVTATSDPNLSLQDLMAIADKALYRAKQNGRNRVEVEGEPGKRAPAGTETITTSVA